MALIDPKDLDKLRYVQYNDICRGFNMAIDLIQDKAEEMSVEAIPIEYIKKFIEKVDGNYFYPEHIEFAIQDMIEDWEKENE